jgi:hypothetical protein
VCWKIHYSDAEGGVSVDPGKRASLCSGQEGIPLPPRLRKEFRLLQVSKVHQNGESFFVRF